MKKTYVNPEITVELDFSDIITASFEVCEIGDADTISW